MRRGRPAVKSWNSTRPSSRGPASSAPPPPAGEVPRSASRRRGILPASGGGSVSAVHDRRGGVRESQVTRIGRYEIQAELGQGAMGVVYRAHDPQLGRTVALKTLRRDLGLPPEQYADLKRRFYQEATAAGRLNHPNLVAVHDVVELDGIPYMVMEYVEGQTLARLIKAEGPLSPERAVSLIVQVCRALQYAHVRGVVHRDIKPGNILVDESGQAKVSDFGIARISGSDVTHTGALLGTPAYMSPEQLDGRVVDGRSDLFSLTVALYEAVTGINPFKDRKSVV